MENLDLVLKIANKAVLFPWLLMIVLPNWKYTRLIIYSFLFPVIFALVYLVYTITILPDFSFSDFGSLPKLVALFSLPKAVLIGWLHYLAFDLIIGSWELYDSKKHGIPHFLLIPCLIFTFMLGPIGFLLYLAVRFGYTKQLLIIKD